MKGEFSALKTAIIYAGYGTRASYYDDWLDSFKRADGFVVDAYNIAQGEGRKAFAQDVNQFDVIILLHSVNADNLTYAQDILPSLQSRRGRLFSFVGNELNLPGAPLASKIAFLKEAGVDIVATQLLKETGDYLYADTGAKVVAVPHALNPNAFKPATLNSARPVDIGIRSFRYLSTFLGDDDRNRLIDLFADNLFHPPLVTDIKTDKRLNREDWSLFLNTCKGTVANEAGGYWIDNDDATMNAIKSWIKSQSGGGMVTIASDSPLRRLAHKLPWGGRQFLINRLGKGMIRHEALMGEGTDFDEVYERFFKNKPSAPEITGKCISSRHFDAAGTKTCQIMIEGRFNDILKAEEHYIPLNRDLSNVTDAIAKFRDETYRNEMVERTYEFVQAQHTYTHRIRQIEDVVRSL